MTSSFFKRHRLVILYGAAMAILLLVLKWLEWRFIIFDHAFEVYSGAIAILFTGLGIWLALKLTRPSAPRSNTTASVATHSEATASDANQSAATQTIHNGYSFPPPPSAASADLGLSSRELEVLQLMADGLSNQEIAARLFVSINTIKTHSSRIFEK